MGVTVIEAPVNTQEAWSLRAATIEAPWLACGWSREGQAVRHAAVMEVLRPVAGDTLLDYGCGTGELAARVSSDVAYMGYDPAVGMVERAREDHPGRPFVSYEPTGRFDLVACVGCFNLADGWSKQRTWHAIRHLFDTTYCRTIAVSLYAGDDPNCLRYEEAEAEACGRSLAYNASVERILPNDLLLVVRR